MADGNTFEAKCPKCGEASPFTPKRAGAGGQCPSCSTFVEVKRNVANDGAETWSLVEGESFESIFAQLIDSVGDHDCDCGHGACAVGDETDGPGCH